MDKNNYENHEVKVQIREYLRCIYNACPELRIGQIMVNAAVKGGWTQGDIFYCSDEILLKGLKILWDEV